MIITLNLSQNTKQPWKHASGISPKPGLMLEELKTLQERLTALRDKVDAILEARWSTASLSIGRKLLVTAWELIDT